MSSTQTSTPTATAETTVRIMPEYCNKAVARWVLGNIDKIVIRTMTDDTYDAKEKCLKFCREVLKSTDGIVKVKYAKAKGGNTGRMYARDNKFGSLQTLLREYRHTLCSRDYYDVDIVNCHPTLLLNYCVKNNLPHDRLKEYVETRNTIYAKYAGKKEEVKLAMNKLLFSGQLDAIVASDSFFQNLRTEITDLYAKMRELEKDTYEKVKREKSPDVYNIDGKMCSRVLHEIENGVLVKMEKFFNLNGFTTRVLIYDGLMIHKTKELPDATLRKCEEYVKKKTGQDVKIIVKPMDEGFDIPDDELKNIDEEIIIREDKEGADILLERCSNDIKFSNGRYFIRKTGNVFLEDTTKGNRLAENYLIHRACNMSICKVFEMANGNENIRPYSRNIQGATNLQKMCMVNMPDDDGEFVKKLWETNIGKLCFTNGYYCFKSKAFKPYDDETFSPIYIKREFPVRNETKIKEVFDKVLKPIFWNEEQLNYFLHWASRGLAGEYTEKTWAVGLGNRNSGKGVLTELFKNAFEEYVCDFKAEEMICNRVGNGDIAKKMGWITPFEFRRLYFSNELKTTDDKDRKLKLDGNIIKSLSSGGDTQTARLNYKDQIQFKIQGRMMLMMNEMIPLTPNDALTTLDTFVFQTQFVDEITPDQEEVNKKGDFKFSKADPDIKSTTLKDVEIMDALIHIIIDYYQSSKPKKPTCMVENNKDMQDTDDNVENSIKDLFEITSNKKDTLTIPEIDAIFKENLPNISKSTYKLKLASMGVKLTNSGGRGRFYQFIKLKVSEQEPEQPKPKSLF